MVSDSARALAARCAPRANALARRLSREFFESVPGYAELPGEVKDLEVAATVRHGVRHFLRSVMCPAQPSDALQVFRDRAAQRAAEGVPLDLLLRTYALGVYGLWQVMREEAGPEDAAALAELVDLLLQSQGEVVAAVTQRYLDEVGALAADSRTEQSQLIRDLLDGRCDPGQARRRGLVLDGPLLVLAFGADRPDDGGGLVRWRRRLRGLRAGLHGTFGAEVLAALSGPADETCPRCGLIGHAVVPGRADAPAAVVGRVAEGFGAAVHVAAVAVVGPGGLAEAARTATDVVRIARARGLPADAVHRLDDVLLEFHLSRPGPGADRIATLLDPATGRPELLATLRAHLELRLDRRATAARLGVHPNTVDKRLARLTALTGLALDTPHGTALALAAQLLRETPPARVRTVRRLSKGSAAWASDRADAVALACRNSCCGRRRDRFHRAGCHW
ncbi:PucR family transcriptional regulator [Streptomyces sp. NPDC048419]|uniref:PucR family transcriptional regulator n=1 Tax=Streptomyces sp. NPDC048419 TaxID=3365547 RepID=UPI00371A8BF6